MRLQPSQPILGPEEERERITGGFRGREQLVPVVHDG